MKRYSKKVREEAALICAIAASTPGLHCSYWAVRRAMGWREPSRAVELALDAWFHVDDEFGRPGINPLTDAEAEALIRTGWSP